MSYKVFNQSEDVASLQSSINEVIMVSSSIFASDYNTKFYRNIASASSDYDLGGYFQTVFDSAATSSLSTALLDITYGYATGSTYNASVTTTSSQTEKIKIYRHFASTLLGNPDSLFNVNSTDVSECFFISVKRVIQKDEIKKGATTLILNNGTYQLTASDQSANSAFKTAIGGDYAALKFSGTGSEIGQVWYNAGVIVLPSALAWPANPTWSGTKSLTNAQYSGNLNSLNDGLRTHMEYINFHNQTNIYSTVYFCRAYNNEFNYSSNSTFVDDQQRIRVTSGSNITQTRTYVTTVGFYDAQDNLLATARVNKPIMKSPDTEAIFRIRLDY
jgi:hypothetical protein